jgi:hypothetical protein
LVERRLTMQNGNGGQVVLTAGVIAEVQSASNPSGDPHKVRLSKTGLIYCDCEAYRWRSHCRHIDTVMAANPAVRLMVKAGLREKIEKLQSLIKALDE